MELTTQSLDHLTVTMELLEQTDVILVWKNLDGHVLKPDLQLQLVFKLVEME